MEKIKIHMNRAKKTPQHKKISLFSGCRPGAAGFTLVEVMLTLTILGFILLILFGAFRLGIAAWEKGEALKGDSQKARFASERLVRQIKSAVPLRIKSQKTMGDFLAFEGKAQSLKFVSAVSLRARQPEGLVYASYELREGGRLVLYEQKALNKDFLEDPPREEAGIDLLEGAEVRFEYYREEDPAKEQQGEWVEEWNGREEKALPRQVRLTLTPKQVKEGRGEAPVTLLVSLPAYRPEEMKSAPVRRILPQPRAMGRP